MHQLLIIGEKLPENIEKKLRKQEYTFSYTTTETGTMAIIKESPPDLIIVDCSEKLSERLEILSEVKTSYEDFIKFIAICPERRSSESEMEKVKKLCSAYIRKPFRGRDFVNIIHKIIFNIE